MYPRGSQRTPLDQRITLASSTTFAPQLVFLEGDRISLDASRTVKGEALLSPEQILATMGYFEPVDTMPPQPNRPDAQKEFVRELTVFGVYPRYLADGVRQRAGV